MDLINDWFDAMATVRQVLSKVALFLPFVGIFGLLWLIFRKTKPEVNPFKRWKFWIVFTLFVWALLLCYVLILTIALAAGAKK